MKKPKAKISVIEIAIVILMMGMIYWFYRAISDPCTPCGYVNYQKKVEPGWTSDGGKYCWECNDLTNPDRGTGLRYVSIRRALKGCPDIYRKSYNEQVIKMNADLVRQGFEPRFEIIEEK